MLRHLDFYLIENFNTAILFSGIEDGVCFK